MRKLRFVAALFLFSIAVLPVIAQVDSGRLDGIVQDPTGAVVPGAKVVALNIKTQKSTQASSDAQGNFVIPALQPGTYQVTVDAPGFRKTVINAIELNVDSTVSQIVKLEIGQTTETVMVEASTVSVQTTDSQNGQVINLKDIDTLPVLGRTPIGLSYFQPGVQIFQNGNNAGVDYSYSHINGTRQGSNNNTLDGIDVNDAVTPRLGLSLTANNSDSVGEFRVVTEGGKAEYGRNAGGQVELITRSGTNEYHGNLFDYLRNTDLNANDFFSNAAGVARPLYIRNIFGGSMGGPIRHNRLFIFGNYQGNRTHQQISRTRTVPTDSAKQGIFKWMSGGAVQSYDIIANDPRHVGIDPFIASLLKNYPSPNTTSVGDGLNSSGFRFNNPNGNLEDQFTIKADYNVTSSQHVFFRQSWQRNSSIDSLNNADAYFPGQPQGTQGGKRWGNAAGWDWTLSATVVNEFRYGHQSASVDFLRPGRLAGPMIGTVTSSINNSWQLPLNPAYAQGRNSPVNEWTDNLTRIHGNHTFKVGGNIHFTKQYGYNAANIFPNLNLSTANGNVPPASAAPPGLSSTDLTIFQGLYNNLFGRVSSITQTFYSNLQTFQAAGTPRVRNFIFHEYGFFGQDDWRITRNLTLNIGLRWEFSGVPYEQDSLAGTIDQAAAVNFASHLDNLTIKRGGQWYNNDWRSFAPRIGLSWDPRGDGKTAIRANYGVFYDRIIGSTTSLVDGNTPGFAQSVPVYPNQSAGSDVRISDNPALPAQPPAPVLTLPATRSTSVVVFNPNLRTGYVHEWSLNVQREVARNTVLQVGYLGNRGVKLFYDADVNQTRIYGDFLQSFQQIQAFIANGAAVPASNTLVKIFGTPQAAISAIGQSTFTTGQVRIAADAIDTSPVNIAKYAAAGVSQFYLRNYPQYNQVILGNNDGRTYYDSLQVSLRRQVGAFRMSANYTFSKTLDNFSSNTGSSQEGNGFTDPIDNYSSRLTKGRASYDIPHVFNFAGSYTLPIGRGHTFGANLPRLANTLLGGWDLGGLWLWESGSPFTVTSGRETGPSLSNAWADYTGSRNIGTVMRQGNGVYFFTPAEIGNFAFPAAGSIGSGGRNTFRGPRFFDVDVSLVKRFAITERHSVAFRAEAYNLFNNVNFANPGLNISVPNAFGKISNVVGSGRIMQLALRYDF